MIKYKLFGGITASVNGDSYNPAPIKWSGDAEAVKQFLRQRYGPYGRPFNPDMDTPEALHFVLMMHRGYTEAKLIEGEAPQQISATKDDGSLI